VALRLAKLFILDRDGVINADSDDFIKDLREWRPLPGALEAIARLSGAGYSVAVCTNQSGIGRELITVSKLQEIHDAMRAGVEALGGTIGGIYFCPHVPEDGCECRKPRPGLLERAMAEAGVAPKDTIAIGDALRDLLAARSAGCRPILVRTGRGLNSEAEARALGFNDVHDDLAAAVAHALRRDS
jgi:D-glycero-D-manno-heptose 1,7-bisphosphate phosphatase